MPSTTNTVAVPPRAFALNAVADNAPISNSILSRHFEVSLYLMVFTAVGTVVSTGRLDLVVTIVATLALIAKGLRRWRGHGPEISHRLATWLVALLFFLMPLDYFTWSHARASDAPNPTLYAGLLAAVHFLLGTILLRLFSARSRRDHLFLAMLGFAAMLASAVLTVDTAFFALFVLYVVLGISTFISLEMDRASEGAAVAPLDATNPAARRISRALSVTSVSVALGTVVVGALIFFLLPRFTGGYLSSYSVRPTLMSGFNENVELGQIGEIKRSSALVMRVKIEGPPSRFAGVHWRGIALVNFDGWRWSASHGPHARVAPGADGWYSVGDARRLQSRELHYSVLLEPVASDAVFVAADAAAVRGRFAASPGAPDLIRRSVLFTDSTRSIFTPYPNDSESHYEAISYAPAIPADELRAAPTFYPEGIRERYLELPTIDPRVADLTKQITATAPTPYDKAAAIVGYLQSHYGYTLELGSAPVRDPLANFLFDRRAGHCEYFASAMTVMLRVLGIPSRYVNGFQTGEYNDVGGDFIVRASDAHSWVEAYFPGYGWIEFDPTPAAGSSPQKPWYAAFSKYMDWFALQWGEWIVNYDFTHQISLAQGMQRTSREWVGGIHDRFVRVHDALASRMKRWQARAADSAWKSPVGVFALALAIGALSWFAADKRRMARLRDLWSLRFARSPRVTPRLASLHYAEMLRILAKRGFHKSDGATALEFAAAFQQPELAAPVARMTNLYQSARFGDSAANSEAASALLREIRAASANLRHARS